MYFIAYFLFLSLSRSPIHMGERYNTRVYMYVCVCVWCVCVCHTLSDSRLGRAFCRTAFVLGSWKRNFSLLFGKPLEISKILRRADIQKVVMGFQQLQSGPPTRHLPHFGVEDMTKSRTIDLSLSNDKTVLRNFSDQQLPASELCAHISVDR